MAYRRNRSKKCNSWIAVLAFLGVITSGSLTDGCWAAFASNYSMSLGEQFTDNVFFTKDKSSDFITLITPTLNFLYAPQGQILPTVNLSISPQAQIFAHNSDLNNFGRRMSMNAGYTEQLTPRISVNFSDTLSRDGVSRAGGIGGGGLLGTPTSGNGIGSTPNSQNLQNFTSVGDVVTNIVSARGTFLYQPNLSFNADYSNSFTKFLDEGGSETYNQMGVRGVYNWRQEHNFHAGYYISVYNARNGDNSVIHNFDVGDDYFSNVQVRLSPTLTIAFSTGASFNTGSDGPNIANNTSLTITKLWQTSTLQGGIRKGLTPSFGVSGISDTTTFFTDFNSQVTDRLSTKINVSYSLWNTDDENFRTFQATAGLQYAINSWLSSNLNYGFYSTNGGSGGSITCGSGSSNATCIPKGTVNANTVWFALTANFNLWPNPGLSRGISSSSAVPIVRPPFASGQAAPAGGAATP
jgi:hypothetical protein